MIFIYSQNIWKPYISAQTFVCVILQVLTRSGLDLDLRGKCILINQRAYVNDSCVLYKVKRLTVLIGKIAC